MCRRNSRWAVFVTLGLSVALSCHANTDNDTFPSPIFSNRTQTAIQLSLIAYFDNPENRFGFDTFQVFNDDNRNQAVLASLDQHCYVGFRGTNLRCFKDVLSYFTIGFQTVCQRDTSEERCCTSRTSFAQAYYTSYTADLEAAIVSCLSNRTELILTGHSKGGTAAQIAGLVWQSHHPHVVTFGNEASLDQACGQFIKHPMRWSRFVNTANKFWWSNGLKYDQLPFWPRWKKLYNHGHTYVLSNGGLAQTPLNSQTSFRPVVFWSLFTFHLVSHYRDRMEQLPKTIVAGYLSGSPCTQDVECQSGQCSKGAWQWVLLLPGTCA